MRTVGVGANKKESSDVDELKTANIAAIQRIAQLEEIIAERNATIQDLSKQVEDLTSANKNLTKKLTDSKKAE